VRYADHLVVLARYQGSRLTGWIESKLEGWRGLEINREKTRVVNLKDKGERLDFLGFTFRYSDDLQGRGWQYLKREAVGEGPEEGTGEAARNDRSSAVL
jgi:RNA-directed DNA polymerase